MVRRTDGHYVMHRIIRKANDCFFIVGDAQQWIEGPLFPEQLVAVVSVIWRKDKRISCINSWWRLLSRLWLYLRPFRHFLLRAKKKIKVFRIKLQVD